MPKVTFALLDGSRRVIDARTGESVMEAALLNGVEGIIADCGGALSCATCHVYVDARFAEQAGEASEYEDAMLEEAASERRSTSRLSCQIRISDALDGICVEIPPEQL
jgi:ferredoxin, 2Fe-2S